MPNLSYECICLNLKMLICQFKQKGSSKHMHSDSKKRLSFLALLFAAGDVRR
jgi:hypothetical protein